MDFLKMISLLIIPLLLLPPKQGWSLITPQTEIDWILARQTTRSGAFVLADGGSWVNPYFTNIALTNLLRVNASLTLQTAVKRWMQWYLSKLEYPKTGVAIISDWDSYDDGLRETSRNSQDSTDAYAATFLTLASKYYYASGDTLYLKSILQKLREVAEGALYTFNYDLNLTYAKPGWVEYYLMDNLEVWRGFEDFSALAQSLAEPDISSYWGNKAIAIRSGIEAHLYHPSSGTYLQALSTPPTDWSSLNDGVLANMYTHVYKLPEALGSTRRARIYGLWSSGGAKTRWIQRQYVEGQDGTDFPLAYVSEGVQVNGDLTSLKAWGNNVKSLWFPVRHWTWNINDASYFVLRLVDSQI